MKFTHVLHWKLFIIITHFQPAFLNCEGRLFFCPAVNFIQLRMETNNQSYPPSPRAMSDKANFIRLKGLPDDQPRTGTDNKSTIPQINNSILENQPEILKFVIPFNKRLIFRYPNEFFQSKNGRDFPREKIYPYPNKKAYAFITFVARRPGQNRLM